ncbi:MAG: hypothetical protein KAG10_06240, partial [Methylococcales bacterium]|nr:hypothetical protein [Methylococcales bacterium]
MGITRTTLYKKMALSKGRGEFSASLAVII